MSKLILVFFLMFGLVVPFVNASLDNELSDTETEDGYNSSMSSDGSSYFDPDEAAEDDVVYVNYHLATTGHKPLNEEQRELLKQEIYKMYITSNEKDSPHPLFLEHYATLIQTLGLVINTPARTQYINDLSLDPSFTVALGVDKMEE